MPRANRRRRGDVRGGAVGPGDAPAPIDLGRALGGMERREVHADGEWFVRRVSGAGATRPYRCPGCQQEVLPGVPHVVAWPADGVGGVESRRHWHSVCWSARGRRAPRGSSR